MPLIVDLHVHAKLSKSFPFDPKTLRRAVAQARRAGLDGFALTEHFHAPDFWGMADTLRRIYRYVDGVLYAHDGFPVLTGAELSVQEGCDVLVIGTLQQLAKVDSGLTQPATSGYRPPFAEALAVAREVGVLLVGAHMFRPLKELGKLGAANLAQLDALEINGKDFHAADRLRAAASRLRLPVVGGSDAHLWPQVGIRATVLPIREVTQAAVAQAVTGGRTGVRTLAYGPAAVSICTTYKRLVKARRSSGYLHAASTPPPSQYSLPTVQSTAGGAFEQGGN